MKNPVATYRIQLNKEFDFHDLKTVLPYISNLGISHIYASPIFEARKGSIHGYDQVNPNLISRELGGKDAFKELHKEICALGLKWIQDIVPNHTAYTTENKIVSSIMKKGSASPYYNFLDVDWNHPSQKLKGKILAPFLGESYQQCLRRKEISLNYHNGFTVKYKQKEFPLKIDTYKQILSETHTKKQQKNKNPQTLENQKTTVERLLKCYNENYKLLDELLEKQVFKLDYWKKALKQINYRRFFDISDLICFRTEDPEVFETTHNLLLKLVAQGIISGLRIDHIDGLKDPEEYITRIHEKAPSTYLIVEKILTGEEKLPRSWQVQGTTGYEFLNQLNALFIAFQNENEINRIYQEFTGKKENFAELLYRSKKLVIRDYFNGDIENIARIFQQTLNKKSPGKKYTFKNLKKAITELFAIFPVYRTYLSKTNFNGKDYLLEAISHAKVLTPKAKFELEAIERLLNETDSSPDAQNAVIRLQQFTGAIMAKGLEDTAFYIYNRLLSLNEVGGNPTKFGTQGNEFHSFNIYKQKHWPFTLNATSTHDTKRGEDVRARLNILSEIPTEFERHLTKWTNLNTPKKKYINNKLAPDRNEEYYIYQTLLGALPFKKEAFAEFTERLKIHMVKALREAKNHSNWLKPNLQYEKSVTDFSEKLVSSNQETAFLNDFIPFQKKIAFHGIFNSLSQTLIKITSPGIPDFYQGTELWDLNMVDPDNRRPVDFKKREKFLSQISKITPQNILAVLEKPEDGKIKLLEIHRALRARRKRIDLFEEGTYLPLNVKGTYKKHIVAFSRKKQNNFSITVVPTFTTGLFKSVKPENFDWKNTSLLLPAEFPKEWTEIFTETTITTKNVEGEKTLYIEELLNQFPVALLFSGGQE